MKRLLMLQKKVKNKNKMVTSHKVIWDQSQNIQSFSINIHYVRIILSFFYFQMLVFPKSYQMSCFYWCSRYSRWTRKKVWELDLTQWARTALQITYISICSTLTIFSKITMSERTNRVPMKYVFQLNKLPRNFSSEQHCSIKTKKKSICIIAPSDLES